MTGSVPVRTVAVYLLLSAVLFVQLWLQAIVPATTTNTTPAALEEAGLMQNPVWVLDFGFAFPVMVVGSIWLLRRRVWGVIIAGMMTVMLTIETAGIAVDRLLGQLHDPSDLLDAVLPMFAFLGAEIVISLLVLGGVSHSARRSRTLPTSTGRG